MRHNINITQLGHAFPYILEYVKNSKNIYGYNQINNRNGCISWTKTDRSIRLFTDDVQHYRDNNDWYSVDTSDWNKSYIPDVVKTANLKLYIPNHTPSAYIRSIKYAVTINTWISGKKIELGTYIFKPTDTIAIPNGLIKNGINEYHEYISFDIIDPFYLIYSDEWDMFRKNVCNECENSNYECSTLYVSLYVVDENEEGYLMLDDCIGGYTNFTISDNIDYMELHLKHSIEKLGFELNVTMNEVYDSLCEYIFETYNLDIAKNNMKFDLVIKNKDSIIFDPSLSVVYNAEETYGLAKQYILLSDIKDTLIGKFFNSYDEHNRYIPWCNFEEGWNVVSSLTIYDNDNVELLSFVSNEVPITQELFSTFANGGSEEIINLSEMEIRTFNVVNKIENKIIQVERPSTNGSKSNIVQPVFFRAKDTEVLTLHPMVTENISINLDDYKSKVKQFKLQIGDVVFDQIGANSYGILFKIKANVLPKTSTAGVYYILDENSELVTTGKYNSIV